MLPRVIVVMLVVFAVRLPPLPASAVERAPEIRTSRIWINVESPLKLKSLRGKVVLIDFWAFDCDPCKEAVPYIEKLHEKYAPEDLVVIGVHTPRTQDEREESRLRDAVRRMGIRYPVVADNQQRIWKDYRCDLWPTHFVVDRHGDIRYRRGGGGRYEDLEQAVRMALAEPITPHF